MKKFCLLLAFIIIFTAVPFNALSSEENNNFEYTENSDGTLTVTAYTGNETSITVPETIDGKTVTVIGEGVFNMTDFSDNNLKSVDCARFISLPKTVKEIKSVYSLNSLKNKYFSEFDLPLLKGIEVDAENECFSSKDGVLFNKDQTVLLRYPRSRRGRLYIIPKSVKTVGRAAFSGCKYLQNVKFSKNVETLESEAFIDCSSLTEIYVPASVKKIEKYAIGCKRYIDSDRNAEKEVWTTHIEPAPGFTLFGKKNSAAYKYSRKRKNYISPNALQNTIINKFTFKAFPLSKPKFVSFKKNGKTASFKIKKLSVDSKLDFIYDIAIYSVKGNKKKRLFSPEFKSDVKNGKYTFKFKKKGTYLIKVRRVIGMRANYNGKAYYKTKWATKKIKV